MSTRSYLMTPVVGSSRPERQRTSVVLPEPLRPTIATIVPGSTLNVIPSSTGGENGEYRKPTLFSSTRPSIVCTGARAARSAPCSGSCSTMSFRRLRRTFPYWRSSQMSSRTSSGPFAISTSVLNATSWPTFIAPSITRSDPTQRKRTIVTRVTVEIIASYDIIVKSARNTRCASVVNWASIRLRNAVSAPTDFTVSMPLIASICCEP